MSIFAKRRSGTGSIAVRDVHEVSDAAWSGLPAPYDALAERLAEGTDPSDVCEGLGHRLARDGAGLGEALEGLRTVYRAVLGRDPDFAATRALGVAWSDSTLGFLHEVSCEDPLTGLSSVAHLRCRLEETYQSEAAHGRDARKTRALVVLDHAPPLLRGGEERFVQAFRTVRLAETVRLVFSGGEPIAALGSGRLVVLVERSPLLGRDVASLVEYLDEGRAVDGPVRVWIEGLPASPSALGPLLDEIARA